MEVKRHWYVVKSVTISRSQHLNSLFSNKSSFYRLGSLIFHLLSIQTGRDEKKRENRRSGKSIFFEVGNDRACSDFASKCDIHQEEFCELTSVPRDLWRRWKCVFLQRFSTINNWFSLSPFANRFLMGACSHRTR